MKKIDLLFFNNGKDKEDTLTDESLRNIINTIDAMVRLSGQSCFIIDFDNHILIYRTEELIFLNEVSFKDRQRECSNPYWELISDDTLNKLLSIRNNYLTLNYDLSREEYLQHVCTIDYPIYIKGKEVYINQRFTPLLLRKENIAKIGLFVVEASSQKSFESFIITPSGKRWRFDVEKKKYMEFDLGRTLSIVEKAILHRAKKGMTSEEIAADLYISINTVKTHRLRIFQKLGVHSLQEALSMIGNYKLA
jgi:DNA-binding CsgD family transcriptional regulator